jgi:hypothetical protein
MFGFVIGTLCLVGLIGLRWRMRHAWGGGCGGGYRGWGGHHGHHGHRGWGGWGGHHGAAEDRMGDGMLRMLFRRLDTTPGQEKVIAEAFGELKTAARGMREELFKTREGVGRAVTGDVFDGAVLDEGFARQKVQLEELQRATSDALRKMHEVLDERQRRELVGLLEQLGVLRGFGGSHQHGPYRA